MSKVILFAPLYENIIGSYKAELYIKGKANIRKQNRLLRFIPTMFRIKKGVKEYLMETYSDLHFTAPNIYDQKVKASIGTTSELWDLDGRLLEYFYINIYASSLLYDKLLSPLAANAKKYYVYRLDSVWGPPHNRQYKIRFTPKTKSIQLVKGYMTVTDNVWSIREIRFAGSSEYLRFDNLVQMGDVGEADEFLPVKSECRKDVKGLLHDQSASGSTLYIEPFEIVAMNNDIVKLEGDERREIDRILGVFSDRVLAQSDNIADASERLALLDMYFALGRYGRRLLLPPVRHRRDVPLQQRQRDILIQAIQAQ